MKLINDYYYIGLHHVAGVHGNVGIEDQAAPSDVTDTAERVDGVSAQITRHILNVVTAQSRTGDGPVTEVTNSSRQPIRWLSMVFVQFAI